MTRGLVQVGVLVVALTLLTGAVTATTPTEAQAATTAAVGPPGNGVDKAAGTGLGGDR